MKSQPRQDSIRVQSSNIDLGDSLVRHAREKIETVTNKLFGQVTDADVHFRKEGEATACSIRLKVGRLRPWAAEITHHNPYRAFNYALDKCAAQARRAKAEIREDHGKRLDKHLGINPPTLGTARGPMLSPFDDDDKPDLTTEVGTDDYTKALIQAHKQRSSEIKAASEILDWANKTPFKDAAE
jgi:ribosomal subunit interface protein